METWGIKVINDPSALWCGVVDDSTKQIWVFDEHYEHGMLNDQIAKVIKSKGYAKEVITADSGDQKSIAELKRLGIRRVKKAKKGNDSIIAGIQLINQYKIWVHPLCTHMVEELENYSWKKDKKTEEYINKPIDEFNHLMDAMRYAMEDIGRNNKLETVSLKAFGL